MILCFQPNEAHIPEVAIGAQGIGVVSEYYHRFICLGRWNCVYSSTVERLTVAQEVGVQFPLNTNFFLIVCGCRGVVKRSISKRLRSSIGRIAVSKTAD